MSARTRATDLILNSDGSVYHLHLLPHMLADVVLLVGDPARVKKISRLFSKIEHRISSREFVTHTGRLGRQRVTVTSTGIGTDNVDIVLHELDALANIDLKTGRPFAKKKSLRFIRLGTSGAIQPDIPVGSLLVSADATGLDNLASFYNHKITLRQQQWCTALQASTMLPFRPYVVAASRDLLNDFGSGMVEGHTLTAPGFYAPQGRSIRIRARHRDFLKVLSSFSLLDQRLSNIEMETAGLYLLSNVMGHHAVSLNAILANRVTGIFSKEPEKVVERLITTTLERL